LEASVRLIERLSREEDRAVASDYLTAIRIFFLRVQPEGESACRHYGQRYGQNDACSMPAPCPLSAASATCEQRSAYDCPVSGRPVAPGAFALAEVAATDG